MENNKIIKNKILLMEKLKELQGYDLDTEKNHAEADDILCDFLILLGHGDIVNEYNKISKWYA